MVRLLFVVGAACIILALALILTSFVTLWLVGHSVKAHDPDLWESMRPGFYGSRTVQFRHSEHLRDFFKRREYESFNDPALNRRARAYVVMVRAAVAAALVGALGTVVWAYWG